jgi:hypothetical protein
MLNRKQIDKLKQDLEKARADLLCRIDTPAKRKEVARLSGESFPYLSDFMAGRKKVSDALIVKILDKVVE